MSNRSNFLQFLVQIIGATRPIIYKLAEGGLWYLIHKLQKCVQYIQA